MVNNDEELSLKDILNAFSNIAKLVDNKLIKQLIHSITIINIMYYFSYTVLTETTGGWNGLSKSFPVFLIR